MSDRDHGDLQKACPLLDIPKWAARYAANRVLHVLMVFGLTAAICAITMAVTLYAVGSGVDALIVASIALNVLIFAVIVYLAVSGRLKAMVERAGGHVLPAAELRARMHGRYDWLLPLPLAAILILAKTFGVPAQYWQPLTAIYVIPAGVYIVGRNGWIEWPSLLCPVLYAEHAILVLAGVRLYIGVWYVDVFVPLGVYAVAGLIAAQIYGCYALRRLRNLTRQSGPEEQQ